MLCCFFFCFFFSFFFIVSSSIPLLQVEMDEILLNIYELNLEMGFWVNLKTSTSKSWSQKPCLDCKEPTQNWVLQILKLVPVLIYQIPHVCLVDFQLHDKFKNYITDFKGMVERYFLTKYYTQYSRILPVVTVYMQCK